MQQSSLPDYTEQLQKVMERAGVANFKQLVSRAGISQRQLRRLRRGEVLAIQVETLLKLSEVLQLSVNEMLNIFDSTAIYNNASGGEELGLKQEYERLEQQLGQQRERLIKEFQQASLQVLESWLIQWPTAAYAARQNEQLSAVKLLPLVQPVEQLMLEWGIFAIASVGDEIPYNPQWHELMSGIAEPGDIVRVRYTGYRQGDKLLYRAKVSPI